MTCDVSSRHDGAPLGPTWLYSGVPAPTGRDAMTAAAIQPTWDEAGTRLMFTASVAGQSRRAARFVPVDTASVLSLVGKQQLGRRGTLDAPRREPYSR